MLRSQDAIAPCERFHPDRCGSATSDRARRARMACHPAGDPRRSSATCSGCSDLRMRLLLVNDFTPIDAVLQHQIERAAREWLATPQATRGARPQLALDAPISGCDCSL